MLTTLPFQLLGFVDVAGLLVTGYWHDVVCGFTESPMSYSREVAKLFRLFKSVSKATLAKIPNILTQILRNYTVDLIPKLLSVTLSVLQIIANVLPVIINHADKV